MLKMKNTRRVIAVLLAAVMCVLCFAACGKDATDTNTIDIKNAKTIADLKGAKIAGSDRHLPRRRPPPDRGCPGQQLPRVRRPARRSPERRDRRLYLGGADRSLRYHDRLHPHLPAL